MSVQMKRKVRPKGQTGRVLALGAHIGRAPRRTGKPDWFARLEFRREAKKTLSALPVEELLKVGVPRGQVELIAVYYASIWDLATANIAELRRIPGVGERTLRKVWQGLKSRHVNPDWTVD